MQPLHFFRTSILLSRDGALDEPQQEVRDEREDIVLPLLSRLPAELPVLPASLPVWRQVIELALRGRLRSAARLFIVETA